MKTIRLLDGPYAGETREVPEDCDWIMLGRGPRTESNPGTVYRPITLDDPDSAWWTA